MAARNARLLDAEFVRFVLTRPTAYLSRLGTLTPDQILAGGERLLAQLENCSAAEADHQVNCWCLAFADADQIRTLRKRYSSHRHRIDKQITSMTLRTQTLAVLQSTMAREGLDSYDEAILWLCQDKEQAG
ncbi:hypothetical protein [Ferrimonas marina]|uniref:Uncharacterized protein n=1 Tax=Ferrimonas marina TaxID=299255 RepID=A0A1M5UIC0_9GAMM|nr:hypothetical protein [Ferrimonas marina]SHH62774.1 hypothetical protein SAMN02745129_2588 [Ferrimonas marina]